MDPRISFKQVSVETDSAQSGFVELYKTAFAEAPYFEVYEPEWIVSAVWNPHVPHCIIVAQHEDKVIGFGCAHAILEEISTVGNFLREKISKESIPFPLESTIYMSELAVLKAFRGQGIGSELITKRQEWAKSKGFTHYCMRTAEKGSNSKKLYETHGAIKAPFTQHIIAEGAVTESKERIFLYGTL